MTETSRFATIRVDQFVAAPPTAVWRRRPPPARRAWCSTGSLTRRATGFGPHRTGYLPGMAITDSREVVIEATPDEILDVLFDIESLPEWSSAHKKVEVLERDDQNHPTRSRQVVKLVGVSDEQELAYTVYDDGVGWTLPRSPS